MEDAIKKITECTTKTETNINLKQIKTIRDVKEADEILANLLMNVWQVFKSIKLAGLDHDEEFLKALVRWNKEYSKINKVIDQESKNLTSSAINDIVLKVEDVNQVGRQIAQVIYKHTPPITDSIAKKSRMKCLICSFIVIIFVIIMLPIIYIIN